MNDKQFVYYRQEENGSGFPTAKPSYEEILSLLVLKFPKMAEIQTKNLAPWSEELFERRGMEKDLE